ncbi:glycosyltransferase family 4 protein [Idiomarina loihiensis]|uniref:Glycosyltransferase n=1 Tax=Idiomarina loihiensis (strain ATCC BAA-735 / DSM 15497 / L2-TR) TaxID=283942 RepID=Q5QWU5_IDILO|nr:glycosyltransferase [Idiomarina loihiensis]AAV81399.1 Glycosyltransferase [Idiomarina loihiensis L2TR]AGM35426.1 glycosyltransferase [Idiomarina loihiensis GSL 199]
MVILHIIAGLEKGGAESTLKRLCLNGTEHEHVVVSLSTLGSVGLELQKAGVKVYCLDIRPSITSVAAIFRLYKIIKLRKPSVVQTWMYHADLVGGIVSRVAGVKKIYWGVHHTYLIKGQSKRVTIFISRINSVLSHFIPTKIVYCANSARVAQEKIGYNKKSGIVIFNGYDTSKFKRDLKLRSVYREKLGLKETDFVIGHVGRYDSLKDYPNLINAIRKVKYKVGGLKVILVGAGLSKDNRELLNVISESTLISKFHLLGPSDDIPGIMNAIDVFVLSSSSEAFPNVLNEAMACGTPCVSTDVGDASAIVGMTGWLSAAGDSSALAEKIYAAYKEFSENKANWEERQYSCRERIVTNFSSQSMVSNYTLLWQS